MKNLLLILIVLFAILFHLNEKKHKKINAELKSQIQLQKDKQELSDSYITILESESELKDSVLIELYKPIVRLQLIAGIKNPDTTFTYLEKVLNPVKIKALLHADLR